MSFVEVQESENWKSASAVNLPNGYVATPGWIISRPSYKDYSVGERAAASSLDGIWNPKGAMSMQGQHQRSPAIWVDNLVFFYEHGKMSEPEILVGEWNKEVMIYGQKTRLHGLVVGGGGNYERMSRRSWTTAEEGHINMQEAADKEIFEELKISPDRIKATQYFGCMDDPFNDPRMHGVRHIFLRWVEVAPSASSELKTVMSVPISKLQSLIEKKTAFVNKEGKQLHFILNHDTMIRVVLHHPEVQNFLTRVRTFYDRIDGFAVNRYNQTRIYSDAERTER